MALGLAIFYSASKLNMLLYNIGPGERYYDRPME